MLSHWWYRLLTVLVALGYAGAVILLYRLVQALTGPVAEIVTVAITVAIAFLLAPLRARLQAAVDRWDRQCRLVAAINRSIHPGQHRGPGTP